MELNFNKSFVFLYNDTSLVAHSDLFQATQPEDITFILLSHIMILFKVKKLRNMTNGQFLLLAMDSKSYQISTNSKPIKQCWYLECACNLYARQILLFLPEREFVVKKGYL